MLTRSAKRSLTFVDALDKSDTHLDISGDDTLVDKPYIPEEPIKEAEEMEYLEVEKETQSIIAGNQIIDQESRTLTHH